LRKTASILIASSLFAAPAAAAENVAIAKCAAPRGTIAVVDGDTQGWAQFGLGSPRDLLGAMVAESNCFTLHSSGSGKPADYLMSAIAGDKSEIDRGMNIAKAALTEGALRSGALGRVPLVGGALGMFGGLGGKKKSIAAGLRIINPANGSTLAVGQGEASKSVVTWGGSGAGGSGTLGQYTGSKDGKLLTSAFATAYNAIVAQAGSLPAPK
jgi:hypothetical protein